MDFSLPVIHRELRGSLTASSVKSTPEIGGLIYNPDTRPVVYCLEEGRVEERRTSVRPTEEGAGARRRAAKDGWLEVGVGVCCVRDWPC